MECSSPNKIITQQTKKRLNWEHNKPLPPSLFHIEVNACIILLYLKTPLYNQENKSTNFNSSSHTVEACNEVMGGLAKMCVILGVYYIGVLFHAFTITGLKNILYTRVFIIEGFVIYWGSTIAQ